VARHRGVFLTRRATRPDRHSETKAHADTYGNFGEPVYTCALRDGIEDGFLTPFKVRQMASTIDEYVYVPGDDVIAGEIEAGRTYTETDLNRIIEIDDRELGHVQDYLGFRQCPRELQRSGMGR
jgi:type I site-specific restriction endonuclease